MYGTILLALLFVPALNLAGMIASRMKRQLSELGIRKAFGASKTSLLLQVFWENLFLTGIGGLFGLLLSYLIVYCGRNWLPDLLSFSVDVMPEGVDSFLTPGMLLNPVVIGITFMVSLVLNVLSALIPALHALKKDIVYSLNEKR
ncbi:ABC transporter permease [Bacteroides fragilis]|nr:ABC transporter permease [Bacteroides fragilis]